MDRADEPVIGIDLGTTFSCVAVYRHGRAVVIENQHGDRVTPSMVAFTQKDRLVGMAAKNQAAANPANTVCEVKRLIGRKFKDPSVQDDIELWPFRAIEGKDGKPMVTVSYMGSDRQFTAEEISAMVLLQLKEAAEKRLGREVRNAVVTVPAYFNDAQRCATRDAATIAGFDVLRLINEPMAAALAYGLDKAWNGRTGMQNILVFDLGGGTFDVTVLEMENGMLKVKATVGDTHLGGVDFDNRLVKHFTQELERTYGPDVTSNPRVLRRLRAECEKTKRMLSTATHAMLHIESLFKGNDFVAEIRRTDFENLTRDLMNKCIDLVENCLQQANLDKHSVDDVILVGGSTRIPRIQQLLSCFFGKDIMCNSVNLDEAVACGAAIQAAMRNGGGRGRGNSNFATINNETSQMKCGKEGQMKRGKEGVYAQV